MTLLTDPVPEGRWALGEYGRRCGRALRDRIRPLPRHLRSHFRGHFGVTRSLVEGLAKIGVGCSYNPQTRDGVCEVVAVLANLRALRQAITWKREGRIRRLLAGPNLVVLPSDEMELVSAPEIDVYLVNSEWTSAAYLSDCPDLRGRCAIWSAGVDTAFWKAAAPGPGRRVLVFDKLPSGEEELVQEVLACVVRSGYEFRRLRYGSFTASDYLSELQNAAPLVGLSRSESQGLAWAEAWSTDVPTLIHARNHHWYGKRRIESSSAPYLSNETGSFFRTVEELGMQLADRHASWRRARPRAWVLANMSDEVCAARFCRLAGIGEGLGPSTGKFVDTSRTSPSE